MNVQWKLRIPLALFTFAMVAILIEHFPEAFLYDHHYFVRSLIPISLVAVIFILLEKTYVNTIEVPALFGIALVFSGILLEALLA